MHDSTPSEKAEDGNDDVEGIEARLEGQSLVGIECAGDDIDGNPDEPLLQILVCQCPDAYDAQGGSEAVSQRHIAVGEGDQQPVNQRPDAANEQSPG